MTYLKTKNKEKEPKQKPKFGTLSCVRFMWRLALKHEPMIIFVGMIIITLLFVLNNLIGLFLSPMIISSIEQSLPVYKVIITILIFIGAGMLVDGLKNYLGGFEWYSRITLRSIISSMISDKCARVSYSTFIDDKKFGEARRIASNATGSNSAASEAIWGTIQSLMVNLINFAIYVVMLTAVKPILLIIILATTVPGYFYSKYINAWGYRHREERDEIDRGLSCVIQESSNIVSAKDIRMFGIRPWFDDMYKSGIRLLDAFHNKGARVYIWKNILDIIFTFLRNGAAYIYLIAMILDNGMSASEFLLYFSMVGGFSGFVSGILGGMSDLRNKCLDISAIRELLTYPDDFPMETGKDVPHTGKPGVIRFENVSFRYPGKEDNPYVLKNVNFTLSSCQRLAVVGLNGAGKTTLIKLLVGFYDPTEGRITYYGVDLRELKRREYYKEFSAVFQDINIFAGTVAENVAASMIDVDKDRVKKCIAYADLTKKVESMPMGYDTLLNRNVYEDAQDLSGGERQRLVLARALYKEAPILLLDEPTAALDPIAESEIYNKYNDMTSGKSAVYISHRLASTRFCDKILLLDNNVIAEEGSHEELVRLGGKYAELYEVQSSYYRNNSENAEGGDGK